jgi:sugar phosphate permease
MAHFPRCSTQAVTSQDIAAPEHRSQVIGIRGSSAALGGVVGPLLVAVVSLWTSPTGIFAIAGGVTLVAVFLALLVLKGRARSYGEPAKDGLSQTLRNDYPQQQTSTGKSAVLTKLEP